MAEPKDGSDSDDEIGPEEYMLRHGEELLKEIERVRKFAKNYYGDRVIDGRSADDFVQDALISLWRCRADPKYLLRKFLLQRKTFFQRIVYKRPRSFHSSQVESRFRYQNALDGLSGKDWNEGIFQFDLMRLKSKYNLTAREIEILRMRSEGMLLIQIAQRLGVCAASMTLYMKTIKDKVRSCCEKEFDLF